MRLSLKLILIISISILTIVIINKDDIFILGSDIADIIMVYPTYILFGFLILFILKLYKKKDFSERFKFIYWILILGVMLFTWVMIKHDPYPTVGPIDSFFNKEKTKRKAIADSLDAVKYLDSIKDAIIKK